MGKSERSEVLKMVEMLQSFHLETNGISSEQWFNEDNERFHKYCANGKEARYEYQKELGIPIPITRWQDSATQVYLELNFRHFLEQFNFFPLDVQNGDKSRPYLTSALTCDIKAQTLTAEDQQCAIVFDNTIICLGQVVSYLFATLAYGRPQSEILSHPNYLVSRIIDHGDILESIYLLIINVIHHGILNHNEVMKMWGPWINKNTEASKEIEAGFISFMIGHEYSHLGLNHHTNTPCVASYDNEFMRGKITRLKKTHKKYLDLFEFPSEEHIDKFYINSQRKELQADSCAFHPYFRRLCLSYSSGNSKESFLAACNVIGATLSIFFIDIFESSLRLIAGGQTLSNCDLWYYDCDLDDICLRKAYPSPATRFGYLYFGVANSYAGENEEYHELAKHFYDFFTTARLHWMMWAESFDIKKSNVKIHDRWKSNIYHPIFSGPTNIYDEKKSIFPAC